VLDVKFNQAFLKKNGMRLVTRCRVCVVHEVKNRHQVYRLGFLFIRRKKF